MQLIVLVSTKEANILNASKIEISVVVTKEQEMVLVITQVLVMLMDS